jgi:hypothetical protein
VDKKIAAEKIHALLEVRISRLLGCDVGDLHSMKTGSMAHFSFLLVGDSEVMPGFNTALTALRDLIGFDKIRNHLLPRRHRKSHTNSLPRTRQEAAKILPISLPLAMQTQLPTFMKTEARSNVSEIVVPVESAEQLMYRKESRVAAGQP